MEFLGLFGAVACFVTVSMVALAALTFVLATLMGGWFKGLSGWDKLASHFAWSLEAPGPIHNVPSRVGHVYFRFGTKIAVTPQGLYLEYKSIYRYPSLVIPWSEFKNKGSSILFWRAACTFEIGSPLITTLTLLEIHCRLIEPYLQNIK